MSFTFAEILGSAGVFLLLVWFFLNLFGFLAHSARSYKVMNAVGAGLSCYSVPSGRRAGGNMVYRCNRRFDRK